MPGHIFARLGMWPEDIDSNLASVAASEKAEAAGIPGTHHRFHAEEFLLYAYLQTGQDGKAKQLVDGINPLADRLDAMPGMDDMKDMSGYVRNEFPAIYDLEMRNWKAAAALRPYPKTSGAFALLTIWARGMANGRLHHAEEVADDLKSYDAAVADLQKSPYADILSRFQLYRVEMVAWQQFAEGEERCGDRDDAEGSG